MSDGNGGYVRIYRSILDNPTFRGVDEAMFFAFLVLKANWKPGERRYDDRIYKLDRGDLVLGERKLAEAFKWSRQKTRGIMSRLEATDMLTRNWDQHGDQRAPVITICNYDIYQTPVEKARPTSQPRTAQGRPKDGPPKKEGKEGKEGNKPTTGAVPSVPSSATQSSGQKESSGNQDSAEDQFWALTDQAQAAKITRSLMGKMAKAIGDYDQAYPALVTALGKDNPAAYVSGIIRKRERDRAATSAATDSTAPSIVREAQQSGQAVEALPNGRWRIAGAIYDAEGQEIGW